MTIRKILLIIVIPLVFLSVIITSLVSNFYIDNYFESYILEEYEKKIEDMKNVSAQILEGKAINPMDLNYFFNDSVLKVELYDSSGNIILSQSNMSEHMQMMRGRNGGRGNKAGIYYDIEDYSIESNGQVLGLLRVYKNAPTTDTVAMDSFKHSLVVGSITAIILSMIIAVAVFLYISKWLSKDLEATKLYAKDIEKEAIKSPEKSKILEIGDIQNSLYNLGVRLRIKQKVRKEKLDTIRHEIKTPITIIKSNIEGALDGVIDMNEDKLQVCLKEVDNIMLTLDGITDAIEEGEKEEKIKLEEVHLGQELEKIADSFRSAYEAKKLELDLKTDDIILMTDKSLLTKIIYNLLSNSYKYTDEGGYVSIKCYEKEDVVIEVSDTGIGISEKDLENIFEPYYRSNNAAGVKGDGLGLHIVKNNLLLLGGTIQVESELKKGTTFFIKLPKKHIYSIIND